MDGPSITIPLNFGHDRILESGDLDPKIKFKNNDMMEFEQLL